MDKSFTEIFSSQPDEILNGDYFYHVPNHEKLTQKITEILGVSYEELEARRKHREDNISANYKQFWDKSTLHGETDPLFYEPWIEDEKAVEVIKKIAADGKPFIDIASSTSMGLAPYIIKLNPEIPCLVTDISADEIKLLRSCICEHLPEYNISLASFDNLEMPLKDNSLDYMTSRYGILSSVPEQKNLYQLSADTEKPINEVYRVLKPGGRFITLEANRECDFDLRKVYDCCNENGTLFGIYTFDEIKAVLEMLVDEPWYDKFKAANFELEIEQKYYKKYTFSQIMNFLHGFTRYHKIRSWTKMTWREELKTENFADWDSAAESNKAEDAGIEFYDADVFYVLRKPDIT